MMTSEELKSKLEKVAKEAEISGHISVSRVLDELCNCMGDPSFFSKTVKTEGQHYKKTKKNSLTQQQERDIVISTVQVIVYYNSKKKCLEVKGKKDNARYDDKLAVLKRTHALNLGDVSVNKRTLSGCVDLDDIHSLEEKKSPRPKWKHQARVNKKRKFENLRNGKEIDQYHPRVFLEDSKIFVL